MFFQTLLWIQSGESATIVNCICDTGERKAWKAQQQANFQLRTLHPAVNLTQCCRSIFYTPGCPNRHRTKLTKADYILSLYVWRETVRKSSVICSWKIPEWLVSPPPHLLHTHINTQTRSSCFMWTAVATYRCWQNLWPLKLQVNCFHLLFKIKIVNCVYFMHDGWL